MRQRAHESRLGACPSNRCSNPSESDSSLDYEQALSPLEYRSDAASAAECAGLRAQGPRLAVFLLKFMRQADLPLRLRVTVAQQALPFAHAKPKPDRPIKYGQSR